jgi:hypothetical protein
MSIEGEGDCPPDRGVTPSMLGTYVLWSDWSVVLCIDFVRALRYCSNNIIIIIIIIIECYRIIIDRSFLDCEDPGQLQSEGSIRG